MPRHGQSSSPVTTAAYGRHRALSPVAEDGAEAEHQHGPSEVSAVESLVALVGALKITSCAAAANPSVCL